MSTKNNTIIKKENQYHHLTLEDRAKIKLTDTRRMKEIIVYHNRDKSTLPASKIPYSIDS